MNFSNTKLSVGILYVGFIVVVSTLCLYFDLPNLLIRGFGDNIYTVFIYILLLIIATLPLDILSSYKLNSFKNRNLYKIILGNLILFLLLSLFAFIIFITYEQRNILLAFTALLFAQLALIHIQELSVKNFFNFRFESFEDLSLIIIPNAPKYMTMNIQYVMKETKQCILTPVKIKIQKSELFLIDFKYSCGIGKIFTSQGNF